MGSPIIFKRYNHEGPHSLPFVDPNIYSSKNERKANEKRVAAAKAELARLASELTAAEQKPNKTPKDKKLIEKIKKAIKKAKEKLKKSEPHGRTGDRH